MFRLQQVKTTQPRRYLVRPNQGLISPGGSEQVQIILVEKDKQALLQSYDSLGQTALDHCKDKFLVQSCGVESDFETEYMDACAKDPTLGYDKLSSMWATITSNKAAVVANKKLHVRHVARVGDKSAEGTLSLPATKKPSKPVEAMDEAELQLELKNLRSKHDELVAFSVNLTAERDLLNNALEQTKRELNHEQKKVAAQKNSNAMSRVVANNTDGATGISTLMLSLIALAMFVIGVRMEAGGYANVFKRVPILNILLGSNGDSHSDQSEGADEF
jgi:vesicle-associated membrane protein-associated protein A